MKRLTESQLIDIIESVVKQTINETKGMTDISRKSKFDYVEGKEGGSCATMKEKYGALDERTMRACKSKGSKSLDEKLHGKQSKLDKAPPFGKITGADFKKLRGEKTEGTCNECGGKMYEEDEKFIQKATKKMEKKGTEGKFAAWCKRHKLATEEGEVTKRCIDKAMKSDDSAVVKMANFAKNIGGFHGAKHKKGGEKKESVKLTESELISLIEAIVIEEKKKSFPKKGTPGIRTYEKAHNASGKENSDYLKSVGKKMKDYLKDGSKGKYETEPSFFPKGNGELAKMSKKAYVPSKDIQDYTDNFTAAALENISYDEIHPNEDWVSDNIKGSSRTGNNPKWANTGESDVNKKRDEVRKKNLLGKVKKKAYNKAVQPAIIDKTGEDEGSSFLNRLESVEAKKMEKLNEEFQRMHEMMNYDKPTQ
jgi:hypothetical protein